MTASSFVPAGNDTTSVPGSVPATTASFVWDWVVWGLLLGTGLAF